MKSFEKFSGDHKTDEEAQETLSRMKSDLSELEDSEKGSSTFSLPFKAPHVDFHTVGTELNIFEFREVLKLLLRIGCEELIEPLADLFVCFVMLVFSLWQMTLFTR